MLHKIVEIETLPGLRLKAMFADGQVRFYDITPLVNQWPAFKSLSEIHGLFGIARIDAGGHGIVWNEEIDLASEEIWQHGIPA